MQIEAGIAAEAIGASQHLPHMGTDEFLKCLSRVALETAAKAADVRVEVRVTDTRAALIKHLNGSTYVHANAHIQLTRDELAADQDRRNRRCEYGSWDDEADDDTNADLEDAQDYFAETDMRVAGADSPRWRRATHRNDPASKPLRSYLVRQSPATSGTSKQRILDNAAAP